MKRLNLGIAKESTGDVWVTKRAYDIPGLYQYRYSSLDGFDCYDRDGWRSQTLTRSLHELSVTYRG